ncbi:low molecular weight phosphotyrosine protein phosphatase [bacterium]|nr:low molecular weight phosphotyrosine protein phosphatase [bacterium]
MIKVLFVCLGNICRSPMAEGLFLHKVKKADLEGKIEVDSSGTGGWHAGERPDHRMRATASRHKVELPSRARKLILEDFALFDYVIPMDQSNMRDVFSLKGNEQEANAEILLMRQFDPLGKDQDVPDPYYGGQNGFEDVFEMLDRSTEELLAYIREQHGI